MALVYVVYFVGALSVAVSLAAGLLSLGRVMGDCPETGRAAAAAAGVIAAGFLVMGASGVTLVAAFLPMAPTPLAGLFLGLGFAGLMLGLGFTNAVSILRRALEPPRPAAAVPAPGPAPVPAPASAEAAG